MGPGQIYRYNKLTWLQEASFGQAGQSIHLREAVPDKNPGQLNITLLICSDGKVKYDVTTQSIIIIIIIATKPLILNRLHYIAPPFTLKRFPGNIFSDTKHI